MNQIQFLLNVQQAFLKKLIVAILCHVSDLCLKKLVAYLLHLYNFFTHENLPRWKTASKFGSGRSSCSSSGSKFWFLILSLIQCDPNWCSKIHTLTKLSPKPKSFSKFRTTSFAFQTLKKSSKHVSSFTAQLLDSDTLLFSNFDVI